MNKSIIALTFAWFSLSISTAGAVQQFTIEPIISPGDTIEGVTVTVGAGVGINDSGTVVGSASKIPEFGVAFKYKSNGCLHQLDYQDYQHR